MFTVLGLTFAVFRLADMEAVQMLQRFSQVGEFYVASKPDGVDATSRAGFMDLLIFDEEADRHVRIAFEDALMATGLVEGGPIPAVAAQAAVAARPAANGNPAVAARAAVAAQAAVVNPYTLVDNSNETTKMKTTGDGTIELSEWLARINLLVKANKDPSDEDPKDLKDACIVIARPFIEHAMLSAVVAVSGGDTGATIFGPSDMQISVRTRPLRHPHCVLCVFSAPPPDGSLQWLHVCTGQHLRQGHRRVRIAVVKPMPV